jgi:hypothetical protein
MLDRISSRRISVSAPDHFGTRDIKDGSLWTVGVPTEAHLHNYCSSALIFASSTCNCALAMLKKLCYSLNELLNFEFCSSDFFYDILVVIYGVESHELVYNPRMENY